MVAVSAVLLLASSITAVVIAESGELMAEGRITAVYVGCIVLGALSLAKVRR